MYEVNSILCIMFDHLNDKYNIIVRICRNRVIDRYNRDKLLLGIPLV